MSGLIGGGGGGADPPLRVTHFVSLSHHELVQE